MASEKRLIDANELVRKTNKLDVFYFTDETDVQIHDCQMVELGGVLAEIDEASTVDAVEVVRCKDCEYWLKDVPGCTDAVGRCEWANYMVGAAGYCVYGERRNDEDT